MEQIYQHLLECEERPFNTETELNDLKRLMDASRLSQTPIITFNYEKCKEKLLYTELIANLKKFKGISDIEEKADYTLIIKFNSLLNSVNFVKFFTLANQVEFNPFIFYMSFDELPETDRVLNDRKEKTNAPKKTKKKAAGNINKYTARFYFFIESSPDFELSKKIIGKKGKNMKNILTDCEIVFKDDRVPKDFLKLRLRGRGSSYKEGTTNKESDEDLHLCISAKNADVLSKAVKLIEQLLESILKEYNAYCKKQGVKPVKKLYRLISDLNK